MALIKVTVKSKGYPAMKRTDINKEIRRAMYRIAGDWHLNYSQDHFTPSAARKYHYTRRKTKNILTGVPRYTKTGRAMAPNGNPLVWSGVSRSLAKIAKIKATTRRSSVTSPVSVFNFRPKGADPNLNMRREYTTVLKSELQDIGRRQAVLLAKELRNSPARSHIKVT